MPEISIIIRTKNEEKWIPHCLGMIFEQDYNDFEVIIVDNNSSDHTVEVVKRYPVASIINIDKFIPGKAINDGIRASTGDYIVCISAHCIPKDNQWLGNLYSNFKDNNKIAGVYGRQLPMAYTSDADKRDLLITFGLDKKSQVKDYFSIMRIACFPDLFGMSFLLMKKRQILRIEFGVRRLQRLAIKSSMSQVHQFTIIMDYTSMRVHQIEPKVLQPYWIG